MKSSRVGVLCVVVLAFAGGCAHEPESVNAAAAPVPTSSAKTAATADTSFEIDLVDDFTDAFRNVSEDSLPQGAGLSLFDEYVPGSTGTFEKIRYVRIVLKKGETARAAATRFHGWLSTIKLPPDTRFGVQEIRERGDNGEDSVVALRSLVLTGKPVLAQADIAKATAMNEGENAYVAIELTPEGGRAFADATDRWSNRRMAIVVDGFVMSAPLIRSRISGGHLSITMGGGNSKENADEAKRLARALQRSPQ